MKVTINGKRTEHIPLSWDDVTFEQSLQLVKIQDYKGQLDTADVIATFLNLDPDTVRKSNIANIEEVIRVISFTHQKPPEILPRSINGYLIPADLNFKSICRYEDLKYLVSKVIPEEGKQITAENLKHYPAMVGIYAMPNYENATLKEREEFAQQFFKAQVGEVLAIGNFTLQKFLALRTPGLKHFQSLLTLMRRLRLALKGFNARLAFSVRFSTWKRKHRISGMSY